jgi:outer membrane protein assembly factor BamB
MCEESGYIYYAFGKTGKEKIVRAKSDGSDPVTVTEGEYACLHELTADSANLYFVSSPGEDAPTGALDTIYRLPLGGGKEQAVTQGNVYSLQNANGKLYWVNDSGDDAPAKINCINMDGSDSKTLFTAKDLLIGSELLVAGGNIYYTDSAFTTPDSNGNGSAYSDLYRMDLGGGNAQKLCRTKTGFIDKLFYDQGKLYFLTEDTDVLNDSLQTLDAKGKAVTLLKNVGYFPQDFGAIEYCGISDNIFYYFTETEDSHSQTDVTDSTVYVYFDLHRFDLKTIRSTVLIHDMEMGDPAIGTLFSVRGKNIRNNGVTGFYILGNDIYFSPYAAS